MNYEHGPLFLEKWNLHRELSALSHYSADKQDTHLIFRLGAQLPILHFVRWGAIDLTRSKNSRHVFTLLKGVTHGAETRPLGSLTNNVWSERGS